jgi:DNA mismatch endonuclease (patch repair protein)
MTDTLSARERSKRMASVRQTDTSPEMRLRKALHRRGLRYRLNVRSLPGSPDIVLPRFRLAVFVHGCFWHQHDGCKSATTPKTNEEFWQRKFQRNKGRDSEALAALRELGWHTIVVWGCEVSTESKAQQVADRIFQQTRSMQPASAARVPSNVRKF